MSEAAKGRGLQALVVFGAFLLFVVEPMVANVLLPRFGGSASVWQVCLAFFQLALVGGYAGSAWLGRLPGARRAWALVVLAGAGALLLPGLPPAGGGEVDAASPGWTAMGLLLRYVALPFMALGLTSNLAQRWAVEGRDAALAGRLVALSNVGSLLGLLAYPLLLESAVGLERQGQLFAAGWLLWAVLLLALGFAHARAPVAEVASNAPERAADVEGDESEPAGDAGPFAAAFLTSGLLSVVTAHVTRDIAPVPFLWVLPLALYLASWVFAFAPWVQVLERRLLLLSGGAALSAVAMVRHEHVQESVVGLMAGLFAICLALHGELAVRAPVDARRARFFVMTSLGGAAGSFAVAFVAPVLFVSSRELQLLLVGAGLAALALGRGLPGRSGAGLAFRGLVAVAMVATLAVFELSGLTNLWLPLAHVRTFNAELMVQESADHTVRRLFHGWVAHGGEILPTGDEPPVATTYYLREAGLGRVMSVLQARGPVRALGVGLGAGTMASLLVPGDTLTFIELEPAMVEIARAHFHFLSRSPGRVDVEVGDGRLRVERRPDGSTDLIALDAFSGDAVPAHLLTVEAMRSYARVLRPGGVLAFHVSNRALDLPAVAAAAAASLGWGHRLLTFDPDPVRHANAYATASDWVVVSADASVLDAPELQPLVRPLAGRPLDAAWTDDHHPLWPIVRW